MTRAITGTELAKLRLDGQWSELYLAIHVPSTVYTARVNQTTFEDPMYQITYDTGSGTLANVIPGMTMYVGSSPGAWDKGLVRIRKTPAATVFYLGETSEINWADNDYLTVVDEFGLWPRHIRLIGTTPYMDYDIAYSDQHTYLNPYPVLGPDRVLWLDGTTVNCLPDASASWVLGSTISSYLWTAPGASATLNLDTATPTITYDAPGVYRIGCSITAANGKSTTGYRYVFIYSQSSMPVTAFQLLSCRGDSAAGGWEFSIRLFDEVGITVRPRSKVILFAKDRYGGALEILGPDTGLENIIAAGWVETESLQYTSDQGNTTFHVKGPASWLQNMSGFPLGVRRSSTTAAAWTDMENLTVDRGLWHLLHWRTTASLCMDSILPGDTKSLPSAEAGATPIWEQLLSVGDLTILAPPRCDRHGRLYIQVDSQYLPTASRSGIPVVMEITKDDWSGEINIERPQSRKCSMLELSGIVDDTDAPVMSWARGGVFTLYGTPQSIEHLLLDNQDAANMLAGNVFAQRNNEFPNIEFKLASNNRFIDIAPNQYLTLTLTPADNPRGLSWTNKKIIPRRLSYTWDDRVGSLGVSLECEAETGGASAIPGITVPITPPPMIGDMIFEIPDFDAWGAWGALTPGDVRLPGFMPQEPPITPVDNTCPADAPATGPYHLNIAGLLKGDVESAKFAHIPAVLRTAGHINPTRYEIRGIFEKNVSGVWGETYDDAFYNVYAHAPGGAIIATGVHDAVTNPRVRTGVLNAPAATKIAYISIQINTELLRPTSITKYLHGGPGAWVGGGVMEWGYWGVGIWASLTDVGGSPVFANYDFDIQSVIELNGVTGTFEYENNGYILVTGDGYLKNYMQGSHWLWASYYWHEAVSGMVWLSQKHKFVSTTTQPLIGTNGHRNGGSCTVIQHHWLTAFRQQTYRINLSGMSVYNLCPLSAWETWLT